ncbi:MAG: glycosyl transferase, family 2 [Chloroflexi bacterium]|nr:glycosyl transferase, family 2 [Chloroflexota bacterium]
MLNNVLQKARNPQAESYPDITTSPTRTIAAIIPAYNEAGRIRRVLQTLHDVRQLGEIIVVDDGSSDGTAQESRLEAESDARIRLIIQPTNMGKGQAIYSGWQATRANCILMLDADLCGLTSQHIVDLYQPVLAGQADMTIGLFHGGYWRTDLSHWATPWLSGQRCFRADLLKKISWEAAAGYGIETALTVAAQLNDWKIVKVPWLGAWHTPSEDRRGFWRGMGRRSMMYLQIIRAWYVAGGLMCLGIRFGRKSRVSNLN